MHDDVLTTALGSMITMQEGHRSPGVERTHQITSTSASSDSNLHMGVGGNLHRIIPPSKQQAYFEELARVFVEATLPRFSSIQYDDIPPHCILHNPLNVSPLGRI